MQSLYDETRFLMKKYNISANKSLGQNFLIDDMVVYNIIKSSDITKEDLVIEIGPGLGTLTKELLEKAGKVICIELDKKMIQILQDRFFMYDNLKIINEDVLKVDLNSIIKTEKENEDIKQVKIVANLPYYITTPIIMKLLEDKLGIETITVMIQKEVAKRLCAIPGDKLSGAITYSVYYYAIAKEVIKVPSSSFIPEPEVESEVIKLCLRKDKPIKDCKEDLLFKVIKVAFMQRRKTLVNALVSSKEFGDKKQIIQILQDLGMNEKVRGETLTLQQFADIAKYIESRQDM